MTAGGGRRTRAFASLVIRRGTPATALVVALAGCGVDTATTAATSAAIKQQEADQGRKTLDDARQKVGQAAQQVQQRADQAGAAADK